MAVKGRWMKGAWWVGTHFHGRRTKKQVGPTKADRRETDRVARKIDGALALGTFEPRKRGEAMPCDAELWRWHRAYAATMKPSYERLTEGVIRTNLPHFGRRDLRELTERDLLVFIKRRLEEGLAVATIRRTVQMPAACGESLLSSAMPVMNGAPGGIRTPDPRIRNSRERDAERRREMGNQPVRRRLRLPKSLDLSPGNRTQTVPKCCLASSSEVLSLLHP